MVSRGKFSPAWRYGLLVAVILAAALVAWPELASDLTDDRFMPHAHCYLDRQGLVSLHLLSDFLIGSAYVAISMTLVYFVRRRDLPFDWMFLAFGTFIIACGATHFMEVWTLWNATYWLSGGVKLLTAIASVTTALLLPPLIPQALALPSPNQLEQANQELALEIAERQRVEAQLRQSESTLRSFFDACPLLMAVIEREGDEFRYVSTNRALAEFLGEDREALVGRRASDLGAWPERLNGEDGTIEFEYRYEREGREGWLHATVSRIGEEAAGCPRFSFVAEEITARKRAEAEHDDLIREQEARQQYKLIAEALPNIVWTARPDGEIDFFNQQWTAYTGLTLEESLESGGQAALHPDDLPLYVARWQRAIEEQAPFEIEYRFRCGSDGTYRWHLGRAVPVRDELGRVIKWLGTCGDIEDQKRLQESLQFLAEAGNALASSLNYETTLASVARLAVSHFADWCAVEVREEEGQIRTMALAHADPARLEAVRVMVDRYPPDPNAPFGSPRVLRTGESELVEQISDGMLTMFARNEEHLAHLRDLGLRSYMAVPMMVRGRILGAVTFVSAESGRCYTETDLRFAESLGRRAAMAMDNARLYGEAQEASRSKDEFLATVSHELRTPLNAILGWSRLLRDGRLDPAAFERALETIERNARLQAQLVEDLLDVSRIITGKLRLDSQATEMAPIVHAAIDAIQPAADAKGIRLLADLDNQAGPVLGDPNRLQQVVWNLLSNAVKFTPKDGQVAIRLARLESQIEISVSDSGPGITPEFLPFVFERFRQADPSSTRKHTGLGLGLAIVKNLVELHGGTVTAQSEGSGRGATFIVQLPLMAVRIGGLPPMDNGPRTASAEEWQSLAGMRVLAVDDEPDACELIAAILEQCGARVTPAYSVSEALRALQEAVESDPFDVLLSDIEMPGTDGYTLIRMIRATEDPRLRQIPAAALTAYAQAVDRSKALLAGFQIHLPKPAEPAELIAVVASLAGRNKEG